MVDGWLWLKLPVGVSALGHKGVNDAVLSATKAFGDEVSSRGPEAARLYFG